MKIILKIFVPLCVGSFIAFGITMLLFGRKPSQTTSAVINPAVTDYTSDNDYYSICEEYSFIQVQSGMHNVYLRSYSGDKTTVELNSPSDASVYVSNNTLCVEADVEMFDMWKWDNLITKNKGDIIINIPDKIYDSLYADLGAGNMEIDGIAANDINLTTSMGNLTCTLPEDFTTESLSLEVSAGEAIIRNASTYQYSINVGMGEAKIYGLSGEGTAEIGMGHATLEYSRFSGDSSVIVGMGECEMIVPDDISAEVYCDIGMGKLTINAGGAKKTCHDAETITLNGGENYIYASVGMGSMSIENSKAKADTPVTTTAVTTIPDALEEIEAVEDVEDIEAVDATAVTEAPARTETVGITEQTETAIA